jgi:hypothetical protein
MAANNPITLFCIRRCIARSLRSSQGDQNHEIKCSLTTHHDQQTYRKNRILFIIPKLHKPPIRTNFRIERRYRTAAERFRKEGGRVSTGSPNGERDLASFGRATSRETSWFRVCCKVRRRVRVLVGSRLLKSPCLARRTLLIKPRRQLETNQSLHDQDRTRT